MAELNWGASEFDWVGQIRQFLLDLARSCLGDTPNIPLSLAQQAVPTADRARTLLEEARGQGLNTDFEAQASVTPILPLLWTERLRKLCLELAEMYLSDQPTLPENISARALELAGIAQEILDRRDQGFSEGTEAIANPAIDPSASAPSHSASGSSPSTAPSHSQELTVTQQIDGLRSALKSEWDRSPKAEAVEWQQMLVLLEVMKGLYDRL